MSDHRPTSGRPRPSRTRPGVARLGILLAALLIVGACSEKIVYVDGDEQGSGYQMVAEAGSPRVHADGQHTPADAVAISGADDRADDLYLPFAIGGDPRVHDGSRPRVVPSVTLAHEREAGESGHDSAVIAVPTAPVVATISARGPGAPGHPQATASPTPHAQLSLGAGLGTPVPSPGPRVGLSPGDDELATVAGPVESVADRTIVVRTPAGSKRVQVREQARIEGEGRGVAADLKPGLFVGAILTPGGPTSTVRVYTPGPSMPQAGVVPMVGAQLGKLTAFGSIVTLRSGAMVLNTGGETTSVPLPGTVEVLLPVPASASNLAVGTHVLASGVMMADGTLAASALRVTSEGPLAR